VLAEFPVTKVLGFLAEAHLLPAILFRTARKQCDGDVLRLMRARSAVLEKSSQQALIQEVYRFIEQYSVPKDVIVGHPHYHVLVATGCGAHHAGQLLVWRLLLEELMSRGFLRLMIATGTVAAGVDFPARSVVITAHSKRGAEGFNTLSSSEFQQMSGRAGRRGKDNVGFCLIAPGVFSDARVLDEVAKKPPEPLRSAYFASPSTVLNLLKFRTADDLRYTVQKSLASFLDYKAAQALRREAAEQEAKINAGRALSQADKHKALKTVRRKIREAQALEERQIVLLERTLSGLEKLGYLADNHLTEKGYWAAHLCTSLVLELGEAISEFLFDDLSVYEVVGLVASLAGDPHRPYLSIRQNPIKPELFKRLQEILERIRSVYESPYSAEVAVLPNAALTVVTWMEAESWTEFSSLLRLGDVADGDAARLIMQTGEHLGQISRLYETHPELSRLAAEGRRAILKPPLSDDTLVD